MGRCERSAQLQVRRRRTRGLLAAITWLTTCMEFEISEAALDVIRSKGGTAAVDFIDAIG